ncbi:hypothetical protein [Phenylobacterium sp.]|jgi:hypothetical protein|uniref:hypothetical protein n=1 Tax=Phenylobacterium sp. TaxID=1871053 RepID=UPI00378348A4
MEASVPPPRDDRARTIFMPLLTGRTKGATAEEKDYRPVDAEWLGGDVYRVVSVQPEHESWEYPSGATVFAVVLHPGETMLIIVAPCSDFRPGRSEWSAAEGAVQSTDGPPRRAAPRSAAALLLSRIRNSRCVQIAIMTIILGATGLAWSKQYLHLPLHPADPIRASVAASCLILIGALSQARDPPELRALRAPALIVGVAFALSLLVGGFRT